MATPIYQVISYSSMESKENGIILAEKTFFQCLKHFFKDNFLTKQLFLKNGDGSGRFDL